MNRHKVWFLRLNRRYYRTMEQNLHTFTFDRTDWERIRRALIAYTASIEPDRSEAAQIEREYALALASDITFKL
jgi:hypothetical protein